MDMIAPGAEAGVPVRVPLVTKPMGVWGSFQTGRRNVLELIPEIALHQPIVSGRTVKRWHMVMDPGALRHILKDRVEDYPKSDVTKMILRPAIGESLFIAEGAHWHWQRRANRTNRPASTCPRLERRRYAMPRAPELGSSVFTPKMRFWRTGQKSSNWRTRSA